MGFTNNSWAGITGPDSAPTRRALQAASQYLNGPSQYMHVALGDQAFTWTNLPALAGEHPNRPRLIVDLSPFESFRMSVMVRSPAGSAGSAVTLYYTTTLNGTSGFTEMNTLGRVAVDGSATRLKYGVWAQIPQAARTEVCLGVYGLGGDGVTDPQMTNIDVTFRPAFESTAT